MDRIFKILKKENGPRASSAPALELNTIIFKHVYWYMQLISGERLQDHWSSGHTSCDLISRFSDFALYLGTQLVYEHTSFTLLFAYDKTFDPKSSPRSL